MRGKPARIVVAYDVGSAAPKRMREAARANGWELVFALADQAHAQAMKRTLGLLGPVVDSAGRPFGDFIADLRAQDLTGVVTFSEYQIGFAARIAEALGLDYQTPDTATALTDKAAQRERLRAAGVEDVRAHVIREASDVEAALAAVGLPAMVKPVVGVSSRNAFMVSTKEEARQRIPGLLAAEPASGARAERAVLMEECFIGRPTEHPWGDYLAVDAIAFQGQVRPMFVTSKFALAPPFRERGGYGAASFEDASIVKAVCDKACGAIAAVGMRMGIAQAELKITEQGPRVIEVNGRLGGWTDDLANRTKVADPVEVALMCAAGQEPPVPDLNGPEEIAYVYALYAPMDAVRVRSIAGHRRLREIPSVERVYIAVREGQDVDWRLGSASAVAGLWGRSTDLGALARTVDEIENTGWIGYDYQ